MPKHITWNDLVESDKNNIPKKSTSNHNTQKQVTDSSDSVQDDVRELISQISPEAESHIQHIVGVYIYQQLGNQGFTIYDDRCRSTSDYPGTKKAQDEYNAFSNLDKYPVDKATILKLANESRNTATPCADEQTDCVEKCDSEVIEVAEPAADIDNPRIPCVLDKHSLKGKSQDLAALLTDQVYVLDPIALKGQSTVIFAAPNTGKTLTALSLLIDAIQDGRINGEDVYYLNLDDSLQGLTEKVAILEDIGINVLADGHQGFKVYKFPQYLDEISAKDLAHNKIVITDTLKKFLDVMSKSQSAEWGKMVRRFTSKGGTIFSLAHVNKHTNSNGKPVPAGTSDVLDDCDNAYTMQTVSTNEASQMAIVEFVNIKRRGDVPSRVGFMFSIDPIISYEERLASVERVDNAKLEKIKLADKLRSDDEIITVAINCIEEGINTKMRLRDAISERTGISKRKAVQLIEKYEGTDTDKHKWSFTMHEHGRKVYSLLTGDADDK